MSFRWMLSLTIHSKGRGMQTITKSVLGRVSKSKSTGYKVLYAYVRLKIARVT